MQYKIIKFVEDLKNRRKKFIKLNRLCTTIISKCMHYVVQMRSEFSSVRLDCFCLYSGCL